MTTVPHYCPGCGGLHTTQVPPPTSGTPEPVARNLLAEQQEDADWAAPPPATPELREALERITDRLGVLAETSAIEGNPNWTAGSRASFSLAAALLRAALAETPGGEWARRPDSDGGLRGDGPTPA